MITKLAQAFDVDKIIGTVDPSGGAVSYGGLFSGEGPSGFITAVLRTMIVLAGVFALFNFITAGYAFMSAGDDPKKIEGAWAKIWQTFLGMTFAAGTFVLAALLGRLLFGDYNALLQLKIFGP